MVVCLERGANDFHMVQLIPLLPLSYLLKKNPEWCIILVLAYPVCHGKRPLSMYCSVVVTYITYCLHSYENKACLHRCHKLSVSCLPL